jgi:hypothetical protein
VSNGPLGYLTNRVESCGHITMYAGDIFVATAISEKWAYGGERIRP